METYKYTHKTKISKRMLNKKTAKGIIIPDLKLYYRVITIVRKSDILLINGKELKIWTQHQRNQKYTLEVRPYLNKWC